MKVRRLFTRLSAAVLFLTAANLPAYAAQTSSLQDQIAAGEHDFQTGNYGSAERRFRAALDFARNHQGDSSDVASILGSLAQIQLAQSRIEEAEASYAAAMKLAGDGAVDPRIQAMLTLGLASLYSRTARPHLAEPLLTDSLQLTWKVFGRTSPQAAITLKHLGIMYALTERFDDAEKALTAAIELQTALPDADAAETGAMMSSLASLHASRQEWDKAEPLLLRSVSLMEKTLGPDHPDLVGPLENLATYFTARGDPAAAETLRRRVYDIQAKTFGERSLVAALAEAHLAAVLADQGKDDEAGRLFASSLAVQERQDNSSPLYVRTLEQFAELLRKIEKSSEAEDLEGRARLIRWRLVHTVHADDLGR